MTTNLSESRQGELRATNISMVILAVIFVALRLIARIYTRVGLAIDDYTLLVALVSQYTLRGQTAQLTRLPVLSIRSFLFDFARYSPLLMSVS